MTKRVLFFRHGEADWPEWKHSDDERPLTRKGKAEVKRVAKLLRRLGAEPLLIFTSPLTRALQTANAVAKQLCLELSIDRTLGKGFDLKKCQRIVAAHDVDCMVLIGHEPDFSRVIRALTGATIMLRKSGVALVELEEPYDSGKLHWLFPPQLAKHAK